MKRKVYREREYIAMEKVPRATTTDTFVGKGWSWRKNADIKQIKSNLREVGYDKWNLEKIDDILVHRPAKNEMYGKTKNLDYFLFTWKKKRGGEY